MATPRLRPQAPCTANAHAVHCGVLSQSHCDNVVFSKKGRRGPAPSSVSNAWRFDRNGKCGEFGRTIDTRQFSRLQQKSVNLRRPREKEREGERPAELAFEKTIESTAWSASRLLRQTPWGGSVSGDTFRWRKYRTLHCLSTLLHKLSSSWSVRKPADVALPPQSLAFRSAPTASAYSSSPSSAGSG